MTELSANSREPVAQLRGLFVEQLKCALRELDLDKGDLEKGVHGARKHLKKARALLRMLRPAIGETIYRRENVELRDAARPLSRLRDAEVLLRTFDELLHRFQSEPKKLNFDDVRRALTREVRKLTPKEASTAAIETARASINSVRARADRWQVEQERFNAVVEGVKKTYRRGRAGLRSAEAKPTTEHLHDWRKQAKYLWHQLQILSPLSSGELGELADQYHRLSDYLGDEHDLAVLDESLRRLDKVTDDQHDHLVAAIDECRAQLRAKAFQLGKRLYARSARRFQHYLEGLWETSIELAA